ncbi:translocation/assembly module TamB domain-containing protein [Sphingosinicellaceae bacterium]|nr:translocation/assembly module TamB domain-containing protein [Sphingosinicellaceae bacterium]
MRAVRALWLVAALVALVALAVVAGIGFLNSDAGRDFIVRQLPLYAPKSGLTVRAGRIEGTIFGRAAIHDLEFGDPKGVFARAPVATLDWRPVELIHNLLDIHELDVPEVDVLRRPALRPSGDKRILPDIDIVVGKLSIDRIVLAAPVIGSARVVSLTGNADIRSGRARIVLDAAAPAAAGGDSVKLRLDAEPDRDRFDIDAQVAAPAGGVITGLLRIKSPLALSISGDGRWTAWQGRAVARLGAAPLADLVLSAANGRFGVGGTIAPAHLLDGLLARVTTPALRIDATATLADRRANTRFTASAPAFAATGSGLIDFGDESFSGMTIDTRVLKPAAINPRLTARDLRLRARIAGSFRNPIVDYVVTTPAMTFGKNGFTDLRAIGIVQTGARPLVVPLAASASRVTGFGVDADALLHNVRVTGPLTVRGDTLVSDSLVLRSDRITARAVASIALTDSGAFNVLAKGDLPNYLVPGLGVTDVHADVRIVPAGTGARVTGQVGVRVKRLDNAFFATLLEGLPTVTSAIVLNPAGDLGFSNTRVASPGLNFVAAGTRSPTGILQLSGSGTSRRYGPVGVKLVGAIEAPVVDVTLARPGLGAGLSSVSAHLTPSAGNWTFDAKGNSDYGPVAARGLIRATVQPTPIDLAAVTVAGITGHGTIVQTAAGPFSGRLDVAGPGLTGTIGLSAASAVQRADVVVTASNAKLAFGSPVTVGKGDLRATILLPDAGPQVTGRFTATEIRRQDTVLTTASGSIDYRDGHGTAQFDAAGLAESPFTIGGKARLTDGRIEVDGGGTFNSRRIGLQRTAVLTRDGPDWVLAPAIVTTPDGRAEVSGRFGERLAVKARLDNLGLSLLTLVSPTFDFGGRVSGMLDIGMVRGKLPTGTASLRISGLSRAGLASASLPIDLGVNAVLNESGGSARAVIVRAGIVEGRFQAQLRGIPGTAEDPVLERLLATPLFAQARYNGPSQALWPLAGIEAIDVRGPVRITADIGGKLGEPTLTGTIASDGARIENVTLGTVVDKAHLDSRFTASRLELTSFRGEVGKGGTVTGSGSIGLSAVDGFPMDVRFTLKDAQALKRDDLAATVSGDMRVVSGKDGAKITGKLVADKARFRIGRPATVEVPVLAVREVNAEIVRQRVVATAKPTRWELDIAVSAPDRINVEGMGLNSDWRGDITVKGTTTAPALSGRVDMVRGDYDFAGKRFQLTRGVLRFGGTYPPDPILDIAAENVSAGFTATLTITGTGLKPEITFGSVPALPQDEVLSRVLFGTSIASLSAPEALQLAGALASLRGGKGAGLNPINFVRKSLGIDRLRILPADTTTGRRTAIAAGQYIGRRIYLELASDAQGYTATNIEVSLTRSLSILSQVATLGGTSVNLRLKKDY